MDLVNQPPAGSSKDLECASCRLGSEIARPEIRRGEKSASFLCKLIQKSPRGNKLHNTTVRAIFQTELYLSVFPLHFARSILSFPDSCGPCHSPLCLLSLSDRITVYLRRCRMWWSVYLAVLYFSCSCSGFDSFQLLIQGVLFTFTNIGYLMSWGVLFFFFLW